MLTDWEEAPLFQMGTFLLSESGMLKMLNTVILEGRCLEKAFSNCSNWGIIIQYSAIFVLYG